MYRRDEKHRGGSGQFGGSMFELGRVEGRVACGMGEGEREGCAACNYHSLLCWGQLT